MINVLHDRSPSIRTLVRKMAGHGYQFTQFELSCEDNCLPIDVEWNYKDMVHVPFVHSHMDREFIHIGRNIYTTLDFRKFLGVSFPQSVTFYTTRENTIVAHTTLLFFIILVEVSFTKVGELTTLTTTKYAVGTQTGVFKLLFPLVTRLLKRNWDKFTADDRPIRKRSGYLRNLGLTFSDSPPIEYRSTLEINKTGVVLPKNGLPKICYEYRIDENIGKIVLAGDSDHLGLQISFGEEYLQIFPRLCPHRGGELVLDELDNDCVHCPWHGRRFNALLKLVYSDGVQEFEGSLHTASFDGNNLTIRTRAEKYLQFAPDWTKAWVCKPQMHG